MGEATLLFTKQLQLPENLLRASTLNFLVYSRFKEKRSQIQRPYKMNGLFIKRWYKRGLSSSEIYLRLSKQLRS